MLRLLRAAVGADQHAHDGLALLAQALAMRADRPASGSAGSRRWSIGSSTLRSRGGRGRRRRCRCGGDRRADRRRAGCGSLTATGRGRRGRRRIGQRHRARGGRRRRRRLAQHPWGAGRSTGWAAEAAVAVPSACGGAMNSLEHLDRARRPRPRGAAARSAGPRGRPRGAAPRRRRSAHCATGSATSEAAKAVSTIDHCRAGTAARAAESR